jgi:hypothetical protein
MKRAILFFVLGLVGLSLYAETFTVTQVAGNGIQAGAKHPYVTVRFRTKADMYASDLEQAEREMTEPDYASTDSLLAGAPGTIVVRFEGDTLDEAKASNWLVIVRDANGYEFVRERPDRSDPDYTKSRPYYWHDFGMFWLGGYGSTRDQTPIEWPLFVRVASTVSRKAYDFYISREEEDQNE